MSLHSETLCWFHASQFLILLIIAACLTEKQQVRIVCLLSTTLTMIPPIRLCGLVDIVEFDVENSVIIYIQVYFIEL